MSQQQSVYRTREQVSSCFKKRVATTHKIKTPTHSFDSTNFYCSGTMGIRRKVEILFSRTRLSDNAVPAEHWCCSCLSTKQMKNKCWNACIESDPDTRRYLWNNRVAVVNRSSLPLKTRRQGYNPRNIGVSMASPGSSRSGPVDTSRSRVEKDQRDPQHPW